MVLCLFFKKMKNIRCDKCSSLRTYQRQFMYHLIFYCKTCGYSLVFRNDLEG